ncbi:MAG: hypothetical protein HQL69_16130 [Magnetococcales bacterium]|nr:hypothetical protein [Magnetococcales bacterium]
MSKQKKSCPNLNHNRVNVQLRFCAHCGDIVNKKIAPKECSEATHAQRRKGRSFHCVDCGEKLITGSAW